MKVQDEAFFFTVTRASFAQRRKTILNNLTSQLEKGKERKEFILQALNQAGVEPTRRGETLGLEEFARLADALLPHFSS